MTHRLAPSSSAMPFTSSASVASLPLSSHPPPPVALSSTGRSMTAPSLSIDVPRTSTKFVVRDGDLVAEDEPDSDDASSASSICHSPGWDDMMGKKKKKEREEAKRKKKEREKAEAKALARSKAAAKLNEKSRNRLSKAAPPLNKRISRMTFLMPRSNSTPVMPHIMPQLKPVSEDVQEAPKEVEEKRLHAGPSSMPQSNVSRLKPLSDHSRLSSPARNQRSRSSHSVPKESGFIGGLKLKVAEEETAAAARGLAQTDALENALADSAEPEIGSALDMEASASTDPTTTSSPSSSLEVSSRTPQRWESIYEKAANIMRSSSRLSGEIDSRSLDGNERNAATSSRAPDSYFPEHPEEYSTRREPSVASQIRSTSHQRTSEDVDSRGRPSSAFSSGRPSLNTRDTSIDRGTSMERGRMTMPAYGRNQQMVIEEKRGRAVNVASGVTEDARMPSLPRGRSTSIARTMKSERNDSVGKPSTIKPIPRNSQTTSIRPKARAPSVSTNRPPLRDQPLIGSPANSGLHQRRSSKSTLPGIIGLKTAAKAALIWGSAVTSPTKSDSSSHTTPSIEVIPNQRAGHRPSTSTGSIEARSLRKAEKFFGQRIGTASKISPTESQYSSSGDASSPPILDEMQIKEPDNHRAGGDHSRSATDSSEGYLTLDDSSGITTPMASNTNSRHNGSPRADAEDLAYGLGNAQEISQSFVVSKAGQPKVPGTPRFMKHNTKTALRNSSAPQVPLLPEKNVVEKSKKTSPELDERPALERTTSTPELQHDLSFLPALKHQPLLRPSKDNSLHSRTNSTTSSKTQGRGTPDQKPQPNPERDVSYPGDEDIQTSSKPMSSQYLQNARLAIPKPPTRPASIMSAQGPDPIAKMFVVCCSCKYFHDMPSKIYECMARSESVVEDKELGVSGLISTSVRCPWCAHGMTTACCAGYAAVVMLREKLH